MIKRSPSTKSPAQKHRPNLPWNSIVSWIMPTAAFLLVLAMAIGIKIASNWPLVHDASLIHYVVFLMDHGWAPYRDIVEMNTPGTYILEWSAMHSLGGGAFAWWLWDALSGVVAVCASAWIAGVGRRSAGISGGALAYLFHLRTGALNLGQRDWIVAVLLLVAFGCMFQSIRLQRPVWMAGFMAFCGVAASIKPPALGIALCFLISTCWLVQRKHEPGRPTWPKFLLWAVVGGLIPMLITATFLFRWGVTRDFFLVLHGLVPYYASLQRLTYIVLMKRIFVLKPLFLGAFVLFLLGKAWRIWESDFLGAAMLAGAALFLLQGKGWPYHLYTEIAFATLWAMLEVDRALKSAKWERLIATATLLFTVLAVTPWMLRGELTSAYPMQTLSHLESDLNSLGGSQLSGKIQCLDMTMGGCVNVLYRMKLIQSTGFIYDFYLFPKQTTAVTATLQARFLQEIISKPPELIVFSSHTWPGEAYSYEQLQNWPAFRDLLERNYRVVRELPNQPRSAGYRIYHLNSKNNEIASVERR